MARPSFTEKDIAAIRQDLLQGAFLLFREEGAEGLTLRRLAKQMGISHTLLYRYFADKEELCTYLRVMSLDAIYDLTAANDPVDGGPIARLESIWLSLVEFAQTHPAEYEFVFNVPQKDLSENLPLMEARNRSYRFAVGIAQQAYDQGLIALEPSTYTQIAWSIIHGLVTLSEANQLLENRTLDSLIKPAMALLHPTSTTKRRSGRPRAAA